MAGLNTRSPQMSPIQAVVERVALKLDRADVIVRVWYETGLATIIAETHKCTGGLLARASVSEAQLGTDVLKADPVAIADALITQLADQAAPDTDVTAQIPTLDDVPPPLPANETSNFVRLDAAATRSAISRLLGWLAPTSTPRPASPTPVSSAKD